MSKVQGITIDTHTWLQEHLDAIYQDLVKLKSHTSQQNCIVPDYIEYSSQKLFIRSTVNTNTKPISNFQIPYSQKTFAIFFAILEAITSIHSNGAIIRGLGTQNILIGQQIQVLSYFIPKMTLQIQVLCPSEYTQSKFNFSVYNDPPFLDFIKFRQYLAFPPDIRILQKIRFSISCDIYQIGQLFYVLSTGQQPYDPFAVNNLELLQKQKQQADKLLILKGIPSILSNQILKMLYYNQNDYFVSVAEAHSSFNQVWCTLFNKAYNKNIFEFRLFKEKLDLYRIKCHNGVLHQICDHFSGNLSFECLKTLQFDAQSFNIPHGQKLAIVCQEQQQVPSQYLSVNMGIDGDQYASDKSGRLTILQGYFGSGKTSLILDVRYIMATRLQSLSFYIPNDTEDLCFIQDSLLLNYWSSQKIEVQNFYHFLLIYLSQGVMDLKNEIFRQMFISIFQQQKDINLVFALIPGFAKYLQLGQPSMISIINENIKELLFLFIKQLLSCSLMILIILDDFQSNKYMNQFRVLLDLLKKFPRLSILTTEVPGIKLDPSIFCTQIDNQASSLYHTQKVIDKFQLYTEYIQTNDKENQNQQQKTISQTYADIASVQSGVYSEASHLSNTFDQQEIRTKCFAYSAAQRRGIKVSFLAINYLNNEQINEYLVSSLNINQPELSISLYRKTFGSLKLIKDTLLLLYQHSAVISNGIIVNKTLELLEINDLYVAYHFMKLVQKEHLISKRDITVLSASTLLDPCFNSSNIPLLLEMSTEESATSCTNLSAISHLISPALPNCSLKNVNFGIKGQFQQNQFYNGFQNIYIWQNSLLRSIFRENFISQYTQELYKCTKFMLSRFYQQISILENRQSLLNFCYIPVVQLEHIKSYADNILEDIQMISNIPDTQISNNSSIIKLAGRQTQSKLLQELISKKNRSLQQAIQSIDKQDVVYYYDGLFFAVDILTFCLNSCQQIFTDIFDQLEVMKLNQYCVNSSLLLGQIPQIYASQVNDSLNKIREIDHFLSSQNILTYVDINGSLGLNVIDIGKLVEIVKNSQPTSTFSQIYETIKTYELLKQYISQNQNFNILLQRQSNFYFLNTIKFSNIQPVYKRLKLINSLFDQLVLQQNYSMAVQLANNVLTDLNYIKRSTVKSCFQELFHRNSILLACIYSITDYLQIIQFQILQPISENEYNLQYLIFKVISLFIFINKPFLAINFAQSLLEKSIISGQMSQFSLFCLHFLTTINSQLSNYKDVSLDIVIISRSIINDVAIKIDNNLTLNLMYVNQLANIEFIQELIDTFVVDKLQIKLNVYFTKFNSFNTEDYVTFSIFSLMMIVNKNYLFLAGLSKSLLQNAIYVNLASVSDFSLVLVLCCKKIINNETYVVNLPTNMNTIDLVSVISKLFIAYSSKNYQLMVDIKQGGFYFIDFMIQKIQYDCLSQFNSIEKNLFILDKIQSQEDFGMQLSNFQQKALKWFNVGIEE